jgi:hypothetical protein
LEESFDIWNLFYWYLFGFWCLGFGIYNVFQCALIIVREQGIKNGVFKIEGLSGSQIGKFLINE